MIYPANFEQKIGFDRLREQVAALCTMRAARGKLAEETFSASAREIGRRLELADQMRLLLDMEHDFPGGEYPDVDHVVAKLRVEGTFLDVGEVVTLHRALSLVGSVVAFILAREGQYPALYARSRGVEAFPGIVQRIDAIVDRFGNIRDNASPALLEIRRAIREREGQAAKRLQAVLAAAKGAGIVDADAQISIREGKAVIPVAAANKRKLQGFIHDESATGRTFYVEPVEVVEINNELRELEYAERREIVRILSEFTDSVRPDAGLIAASGDYLAEIDMLRAKGRWASQNGCVKPIISDDDRLVLKNARHPLLQQTLRAQGREVVPLDMQLDRRKHILVISGPNAGGKSVCLKTTGLVQYMFQCGFPVPASEVSELPVFRSIFIDIGDEQSIDDDLSTYSSHLLNMKNMLSGASSSALVLIDEFGSGTEPVIGGAIAEAILERLLAKGCYGVITTHYANIKYYASNTEGIANGAMMFDVQNIRPLFRLEMGKPGSSFAVEIARKIGLPEDIIRAAGEKAGSDHINIEKQLREIARDKHYWEQKRDRIRQTDRKVEELEQTYAGQLSKIRAERQEILKKAKLEAQQLIADANRQIENTIRTIREAQAEKELTRLARRELDDFRDAVAKADTADKDAEVAREIERIERRRQRREERKAQRGEAQAAGGCPCRGSETARGGGRVESPHGRTGYGRRGAVGQGAQGAGRLRPDTDYGRPEDADRGLEQRVPRGDTPADGADGGVGRHFGPQAQLQRPYRRAGHACRRGAGRRAGFHRRRPDGGRGVGVDSPRQGHGGSQGGDTPLPAHGARGRKRPRRACRPGRGGNYDRDI